MPDSSKRSAAAKPKARSAPNSAHEASLPVSRQTPLLEWIAAGVGLVLILATLGVIGAEVLRRDDSAPRFTVRTVAVTPSAGGYLMTIEVRNEGGAPAAGVVVEGELTPPDGEGESAEMTFDFVADHSAREGGLFFKGDPRQGQVVLRAKSYVDP